MPTFIDESGEGGVLRSASSRFFRLAAVWIPTHADADAFRADVKSLRKRLSVPDDFEFHFTKTIGCESRCQAFYELAIQHPVRFAFASVDKSGQPFARQSTRFVYWGACVQLAATLRPLYIGMGKKRLNDPVIVDDCANGEFLGVVESVFRGLGKACGMKLIKDAVFKNSKSDELIQLADMVLGACVSRESGRTTRWYDMIAKLDQDNHRI